MRQPDAEGRRWSRRRRVGEQAIQALAITSQMALLYPPGIDEWMRRELGVGSTPSTDARDDERTAGERGRARDDRAGA